MFSVEKSALFFGNGNRNRNRRRRVNNRRIYGGQGVIYT
jgi:hypothetical protein